MKKAELIRKVGNISKVEDTRDVLLEIIEAVSTANREVISLKKEVTEESTITPAEAKTFQDAVRVKGVEVLGGKASAAYADKALRKRVFMDIHTEVKRNYGLVLESGRQLGYVFLKRKYLDNALNCISKYIAPVVLANEIEATNESYE